MNSNLNFMTSTSLNYQYDDIVDDTLSLENENDLNDNFLDANIQNIDIQNFSTSSPEKNSQDSPSSLLIDKERADESNEFRIMIVCLGLIIISIGILANLIFSLLIMCRKRKMRRRTHSSSTLLLMTSMSIAYLLFFIFYCFKISIYFNVDTIIKFHIYDITENWIYGAFMCKFISGLPICCKLISRLSILTLAFKRIISLVLFNSSQKSRKDLDTNVNILAKNKKSKNSNTFLGSIVLLIIFLIWLSSLAATWPVFSSYKLTDSSICDSTYDFPNDIKKFSSIYFYYLVYALALPCTLILISLLVLFILSFVKLKSSASSSTISSSQSTPSKKAKSHSFDEIDLSTSNHSDSNPHRPNNLLLWSMFILHLACSLPQELYRYFQLTRNDFEDKQFLESYLEMALEKPLVRARPYYSMQLLYISEFAFMPLLFILFFTCSARLRRFKTESNTSLSASKKENKCKNCLSTCFYDSDLISLGGESSKTIYDNQSNEQSLNDALLDSSNQFNTNESKPNYKKSLKSPTPFELANAKQSQEQIPFTYSLTNSSLNNSSSNNNENVLHIIQHPSWRINIKQPSGYNENTKGSVQLPFNYVKTNMYNS